MRSLIKPVTLLLTLVTMLLFVGSALATPSLSINKKSVAPGEQISVSFTVYPGLPSNAWIGIIPAHIPHGSEAVNDQHDISYQYLQGRTRGTMTFTAPSNPGTYDFRLHDTDDNGVELDSVTFVVGSRYSSSEVSDGDNVDALVTGGGRGEATLHLDRREYYQGDKIRVRFTAPSHYPSNAWIGIIPAHIPHGSEAVNDQHDHSYQYIQKRTRGEMIFTAPGPGQWDFRLHDTDNNGREITHVTFTVH